jgi:hypothetical protein
LNTNDIRRGARRLRNELKLSDRSEAQQRAFGRNLTAFGNGSNQAIAEETLFGLRKFYGVVKERDKDAHLFIAEARLYAARNGQFKNKLSALFREVHEELTSVLERFQTQAGPRMEFPQTNLS